MGEESSPASRGRGLKRPGRRARLFELRVARFTRAWIETYQDDSDRPQLWSPASRGRGLKLRYWVRSPAGRNVARFTRAWIETSKQKIGTLYHLVARFTRAWIETTFQEYRAMSDPSPASRGRGLKLTCTGYDDVTLLVARFTRAWIETS